MVKVEDHDTVGSSYYANVGSSSSIPSSGPLSVTEVKVEYQADSAFSDDFLYTKVGSSSSQPSSGPAVVKEENLKSSSSGDLRSHFIGMGFSSVLVDRVIQENGGGDVDLLLEALIKYLKSSPEASDSWDDFSIDGKEEENSPIELTSGCKQEVEDLSGPFSKAESDKRSYLSMMDFSEREIDLAISGLGTHASLPELVDFIVTAQTAGSSGERMNSSIEHDNGQTEEKTTATLFGTMDKTLCLLQMGFTENEVSAAIDKFGPEIPISELADSIFATRMAFNVNKEEDQWEWDDTTHSNEQNQNGLGFQDHATNELLKCPRPLTDAWITKAPVPDDGWITKASSSNAPFITKASSSNAPPYDYEDEKSIKQAKHVSVEDDWESSYDIKPNEYHDPYNIKEEIQPSLRMPNLRSSNSNGISMAPYFFYGNVVDVSQGTWRKLSQFLYAAKPEFVNSQFFSALIRKEGYLHNLPTERRFHIIPKPPMTVEEALPHTKKWWPSWDTRKQLSCISSETTGVFQLCERLGRMVIDSHGFLSKEQQTDIIHHCKRLNLIWVGPNKLRPLEPDQAENILGFPKDHTEIWGLEPPHRLAALKYCFQTDTIGYHLSVLKNMYPDGIRVLSIFSGVGGAEDALHRLGIWLKVVVSVEASEINQKIFKRWWQNTGQPGVLKQIAGIEKLTSNIVESFMNEFGGFDIIIGANPGEFSRPNINSSIDLDFNLFFEFVRVFQRVRSMMGRYG